MYELLRKMIVLWLGCFGSQKQKHFLQERKEQDFSVLRKSIRYWIHASSVGEVNLLDSFLKECLAKLEGEILLTVFTETGKEIAEKKYGTEERIQILYFPLDDKKQLQAMLENISLKTLFLVETELWPNLIRVVSQKARVVLINGRLSERSFGRYRKLRFFLEPLLQQISYFYLQSEEDKKRFIDLGAKETACEVVGNLKFDIQLPSISKEEAENFKRELGLEGRKIWVAGSTRSGEYEVLVNALLQLDSSYVLVLVPRHLEKVPEIETYLKERKLSYRLYSDSHSKEQSSVLLVDAMGVLRKLYAIADCSFVGGSLVNIGGHSILEPLSYLKTPMFGPYTQNVKEIAREMLIKNLGYQVQNEVELVAAIHKIEQQTPKVIQDIQDFLEANRQVGSRILEREES